jgi:hypothetical protein
MIAVAALLAATLLAPADLDQGFGRNGRQTLDPSDLVRAVAVQPDGRILAAGGLFSVTDSGDPRRVPPQPRREPRQRLR